MSPQLHANSSRTNPPATFGSSLQPPLWPYGAEVRGDQYSDQYSDTILGSADWLAIVWPNLKCSQTNKSHRYMRFDSKLSRCLPVLIRNKLCRTSYAGQVMGRLNMHAIRIVGAS